MSIIRLGGHKGMYLRQGDIQSVQSNYLFLFEEKTRLEVLRR